MKQSSDVIPKKNPIIPLCLTLLILIAPNTQSWGQTDLKEKVIPPLKASIQTRQRSQQELDAWEKERIALKAKYDLLTAKNKRLTQRYRELKKQAKLHQKTLTALEHRERESRKIAAEIGPFIETIYTRLADLKATDTPFLTQERTQRLSHLQEMLAKGDIGFAEKYRKIMDALLIEAEYGNTIEVYQEKITLEKEEVLGDIFRLGRVSLFFLSRDHATAAFFNVAQQKWDPLDQRYVASIQAAVEMGAKHRPIDLLCLPIGRLELSRKEGGIE